MFLNCENLNYLIFFDIVKRYYGDEFFFNLRWIKPYKLTSVIKMILIDIFWKIQDQTSRLRIIETTWNVSEMTWIATQTGDFHLTQYVLLKN